MVVRNYYNPDECTRVERRVVRMTPYRSEDAEECDDE